MGSYLKKSILYAITIPGLLIIFVVLANYHSMVSKGTNVAYQSSDSKWANREVLMKGHEFEQIVFLFEVYKIECEAPNATLQRITPNPPWYSLRHYYNNYQDPKWLVPYIDANEVSISGRQPPALSDHCVNGGNPDAIWSEAKQKAKIYISELSSQSKSMNSTSGNIQLN
jgi:hypothetical protein